MGAARPDWVICGGESGSGARRMKPKWARALRDECADLGIPFFMKQIGSNHDRWPANIRGKGEAEISQSRAGDRIYRLLRQCCEKF